MTAHSFRSRLAGALAAGLLLVSAACSGSNGDDKASTPPAPKPAEPTATPEPEPAPPPEPAPDQRPKMTAEECTAAGGQVVGDIGDGAIHRPDYRCPSGKPPSGAIVPAAGAPTAVEGAVCCPG